MDVAALLVAAAGAPFGKLADCAFRGPRRRWSAARGRSLDASVRNGAVPELATTIKPGSGARSQFYVFVMQVFYAVATNGGASAGRLHQTVSGDRLTLSQLLKASSAPKTTTAGLTMAQCWRKSFFLFYIDLCHLPAKDIYNSRIFLWP